MHEDEEDLDGQLYEEDALQRPERPRAFRFHFMEFCGWAGKVSEQVSAYGWVAGPVIDLDLSSCEGH